MLRSYPRPSRLWTKCLSRRVRRCELGLGRRKLYIADLDPIAQIATVVCDDKAKQHGAWGLRERCKLPQWEQGRTPAAKRFPLFWKRQIAYPGTCCMGQVRGRHGPLAPVRSAYEISLTAMSLLLRLLKSTQQRITDAGV